MVLERLNQQQFDRFSSFIYKKCGIRIDQKKVSLLSNRVRRRLKAGDFENFDVYYKHLTSPAGATELEGFLDAITTNETFFFRTEKHFKWLQNEWVQSLVAQLRAGERSAALRVWSAGCATGAEPYSVAICLAEEAFRLRGWSLTIHGTDISEEALQAAREGVFKTRAVEAVSEKRLQRYFRRQADGERWQVRPEIRAMVDFRRHNLMEPNGEAAYDCIFIRNVLIYFDQDSKRVVIQHLINALVDGGYLVVGPSEGIYGMLAPLKKISPFLYQKVDVARSSDATVGKGDMQR